MPSKLTPLQQEVLEAFFQRERGFFLDLAVTTFPADRAQTSERDGIRLPSTTRVGLIEVASDAMLFLDEVDKLSSDSLRLRFTFRLFDSDQARYRRERACSPKTPAGAKEYLPGSADARSARIGLVGFPAGDPF
jgi:hypothetical protein